MTAAARTRTEAPFAQRAGEVKREHDAEHGKQPERVPVGDRIAQPLVGDIRRGVPHVGRHATDQPGQAHDRRTDHQTSDQPAHVRRACANGAEEDQHQQIQARAIELDQRPAARVRPERRGERERGVQAQGTDRHERGGRQSLERIVRAHDPYQQDLGEHDHRQRGRGGEIAPGVEAHEYDQGAGQEHQRRDGDLSRPRARSVLAHAHSVCHGRYARLDRNDVGRRRAHHCLGGRPPRRQPSALLRREPLQRYAHAAAHDRTHHRRPAKQRTQRSVLCRSAL